MEMSEKAKGKRKVTETDDEGAEHEEKTDGGRKRRRVTVKDPEETDWVRKVTESESWLALLLTICRPLSTGHCAQYRWFYYNAIVIVCQSYCK